MRSTYRVVAGALAVALIASACQPPSSVSSTTSEAQTPGRADHQAEILRVVEEWQSETGARAVLAAIATSDETISVAVGQATSDTGLRDVRVDDSFDVFSITKTFVTAEVLILVDRGVLGLDDSIASYVPELAGKLDVTVRDLLGHRSGLADHRDYPEFWADFFTDLDREWSWEETVGFVLSLPIGPHEYAYSDTNFVILGHLIEEVTGKPLGEVFADDLLRPLELDQTVMLDGSSPAVSVLYGELDCNRLDVFGLDAKTATDLDSSYCADGQITADELPRTAIETFDMGASGMVSSLDDLIVWAEALFSGQAAGDLGGALPQETGDYGLGIDSRHTPLGHAYGHLGGGAFGQARLWHLPDQGITVAAWTGDTTQPALDALVNRMLRTLEDEGGDINDGSDQILAGLADPKPDVRAATAESLVGTGASSPLIEQALEHLVTDDPEETVRASAILGLGAVARDSNSPAAIDALVSALLTDPSDEIRRNAALALGFVGSDALPILEDSYGKQSSAVDEAIDMAIRRLKGDI